MNVVYLAIDVAVKQDIRSPEGITKTNTIRSFGCNGFDTIELMKAFLFANQRPYGLWCIDTSRKVDGHWAPSQYKDRLIYIWRFPC